MKSLRLPKLTKRKAKRFFEITAFERAARSQGFERIAGVDEAGRGPLAGPVVAAACILPPDMYIDGIDDSKALTHEKREALFELLTTHPDVQFGIGVVEAFIIDQINILRAALQAMAAAIAQLQMQPDFVLVDGNQKPPIQIPVQTIVQGDTLSQSIMAAAVIAKVTRDRQMIAYDKEYPVYGFSSHKGYPTPQHFKALKKWGPCPLHRQSFAPIKKEIICCE